MGNSLSSCSFVLKCHLVMSALSSYFKMEGFSPLPCFRPIFPCCFSPWHLSLSRILFFIAMLYLLFVVVPSWSVISTWQEFWQFLDISQGLEWCLARGRPLVNICWMNEWLHEWMYECMCCHGNRKWLSQGTSMDVWKVSITRIWLLRWEGEVKRVAVGGWGVGLLLRLWKEQSERHRAWKRKCKRAYLWQWQSYDI